MLTLRLTLVRACVIVSCSLARLAACADEPGPPANQADEPLLTITGTVLMPDGSPAQGAIVESSPEAREAPRAACADDTGRFQLGGVFGNGALLHARSAAGDYQTTRIISAVDVRAVAATPIELTLAPAIRHEVVVLAGGRPVEGAQVVGSGISFNVHGVTDPDGKVRLRLPAQERLQELLAWHGTLGVRGTRKLDTRPAQERTALSLIPAGPLTVRVVDPDGHPIAGLELGVSVRAADADWASTYKIESARVRTDADGAARVTWAPREKLSYVDPTVFGPAWKIDAIDMEGIGARVVTVHARRRRAVEGRLVMPPGADPAGLLIKGDGFGPGNLGDIPYARARADGSFRLNVASDYAYALGIVDLQWAAPFWSGVILATETAKPAEITMSVEGATPLTVRVTRGSERVPVANTGVNLDTDAEFQWVDTRGKKRSARAGVGSWLPTDADGIARAGVGRGKCRVSVRLGSWSEEQTIVVSSDKPVAVELHRPWLGDRRITGRLTSGGKPFVASPALAARVWSPRGHYEALTFQPEVGADGSFQVAYDAETLWLLFSDTERGLSGFSQVNGEVSSLVLDLVPMAKYSGRVVDEDGPPMVNELVSVFLKSTGLEPLATEKTDVFGRFRFAAVPTGVPLALGIGSWEARVRYHLGDGDRLFAAGEVRQDDVLRPRRVNSPEARPALPLADRVAGACRDAGSSGMCVLLVLKGDESANATTFFANQLLEEERSAVILKYLPVVVERAEFTKEAATLTRYRCPAPGPGQAVLVALDRNGATLATKVIETGDPSAALASGDAFLTQYASPAREAPATLRLGREEARTTGRRVWIIFGGPRCAPCFRLGRWIDEQHATLEKDFVIVKVMWGRDEHVAAVINELPIADRDGIPWHAITEPDGTILATSHGPLGNIGCPSDIESLRHLRGMFERTARKLTIAEVDDLIKSLAPQP